MVKRDDGAFDLDDDRPKSIGRLRGFQGNYGVFVRSYAYIRSLGHSGLREVSEVAVLNANYLLARLREEGVLEHLPAAYERICMHEFVLSGAPMKRDLGIKTLDLAKRLLDHGVHPPTVYFPLIVEEALLVEPTETETRETLDRFAKLAGRDPARSRGGPRDRARRAVHNTGAPTRRGRRGASPSTAPGALMEDLTALATSVAPRVLDEIVELVAISTPSGEVAGAEEALAPVPELPARLAYRAVALLDQGLCPRHAGDADGDRQPAAVAAGPRRHRRRPRRASAAARRR